MRHCFFPRVAASAPRAVRTELSCGQPHLESPRFFRWSDTMRLTRVVATATDPGRCSLTMRHYRDLVAKWNGMNPSRMLRPWLLSLTRWRHHTAVPKPRHGTNMFRSQEVGSELRSIAEMVPDEVLLTEDGWDTVIDKIKQHYHAFLDNNTEVTVEENMYCPSTCFFNAYSEGSWSGRSSQERGRLQASLQPPFSTSSFAHRTTTTDVPHLV